MLVIFRPYLKDHRGLSLMETLIACSLTAIVGLGILALMSYYSKVGHRSDGQLTLMALKADVAKMLSKSSNCAVALNVGSYPAPVVSVVAPTPINLYNLQAGTGVRFWGTPNPAIPPNPTIPSQNLYGPLDIVSVQIGTPITNTGAYFLTTLTLTAVLRNGAGQGRNTYPVVIPFTMLVRGGQVVWCSSNDSGNFKPVIMPNCIAGQSLMQDALDNWICQTI